MRHAVLVSIALLACCGEGARAAEEYTGIVRLNGAPFEAGLALAGKSFSITVYPDKANTCQGGNGDIVKLRQALTNAANGWVKLQYKSCKEGFGLVCLDGNVAGKDFKPAVCMSAALSAPEGAQAPAAPELLEVYKGEASYAITGHETMKLASDNFSVVLRPDAENKCKGQKDFTAFKQSLAANTSGVVQLEYRSCTEENALACIGAGQGRTCASFTLDAGEETENEP